MAKRTFFAMSLVDSFIVLRKAPRKVKSKIENLSFDVSRSQTLLSSFVKHFIVEILPFLSILQF